MRFTAVVVSVLFAFFLLFPPAPAPAEAADPGLVAAVVAVAIGVPFVVARIIKKALSPEPKEPEEPKKEEAPQPEAREQKSAAGEKPTRIGPEDGQIFRD